MIRVVSRGTAQAMRSFYSARGGAPAKKKVSCETNEPMRLPGGKDQYNKEELLLMEEKKVQGTKREATLGVALLLIALITAVVSLATLKYGVDVHVPIAMLAAVVALVDCCWL